MIYGFEAVVLGVSLMLELWIGNSGLAVFCTGYALAYFAVTISPLHALAAALFCGGILDVVYGRPGVFALAVLPAMLGVRQLLFRLTRRDAVWSSALIGGGLGLTAALSVLAAAAFRNPAVLSAMPAAALLVCYLTAGALWFPIQLLMLDFFADQIGVGCYRERPHSRLSASRPAGRNRRLKRRATAGGRRE